MKSPNSEEKEYIIRSYQKQSSHKSNSSCLIQIEDEDLLHTCSSDEKLKTGEVTLETPINDENLNPDIYYVNAKSLSYNNSKIPLRSNNQNAYERKGSIYMHQPFNNISNIRETEQEDDYSLEYI